MGGAAAVNVWRDIVYIVCAMCVAGICVHCMPVQVVRLYEQIPKHTESSEHVFK